MIEPRSFRLFRAIQVPGTHQVSCTAMAGVAIALSLLAGCMSDPDAGKGGPGPSGPLARCIGEAPYAATWEEIMRDVKADPPRCEDSARSMGSTSVMSIWAEPPPGDSVRIHTYVMDSRCRFLVEYRATVAAPQGPTVFWRLWDNRDSEGKPVRSGEYYVNSEIAFQDGRKDTTYQKVGLINPCAL